MMIIILKRLAGAVLCGALLLANSLSAKGDQPASTAHKIHFVLVGDSTVTDKSGWGLGFQQLLTDRATCSNTSAGGRSSKSFRDEGRWTNALALKGDFYLIQFGHNNEKGHPGRETDMATFVSNMVSYVEETRAIGAKPILVTPLCRRQWDKANPAKINSTLTVYADEVKKIAEEKNVPLVDLHAHSKDLYEAWGKEKCVEFSPIKTTDGTNSVDNTHLNEKGSAIFARLVVEELRKVAPELSPCFVTNTAVVK